MMMMMMTTMKLYLYAMSHDKHSTTMSTGQVRSSGH